MAKLIRLSDAELKKLSPEARIKYLRELEEIRRKELEEEQKRVKQELEEAEEQIKETEEELEEERNPQEQHVRPRESDEDLERKLAEVETSSSIETRSYRTEATYESPFARPDRQGSLEHLENISKGKAAGYERREEQQYRSRVDEEKLYVGPEGKQRTTSGLSSEISQNLYKH